jgi:hypothetical protein
MRFTPKSAKEIGDSGEPRFNRILSLIEGCKYSIHDISRTELDASHGLPRFNVPFELGLDLGCKRFDQEKRVLILDIERYRYRTFLSDLAGHDIEEHRGSVETAITIVRNWLRPAVDPVSVSTPSGTTIHARYRTFQYALPEMCADLRWDPDNLPFSDFSWAVHDWIKNNPVK